MRSFWYGVKRWVAGVVSVLSFRFRVWKFWSFAYRALMQPSWNIPIINIPPTMDRWVRDISAYKWTEDGWKRWFDTVSFPAYTEMYMTGDCDDLAFLSATAINRAGRDGVWQDPLEVATVLSVIFQNEEGKISGHAVTLLYNLEDTTYRWMDYDYPVESYYDKEFTIRKHTSLDTVVEQITQWYTGPFGRIVAWAEFDTKISPIRWGRG